MSSNKAENGPPVSILGRSKLWRGDGAALEIVGAHQRDQMRNVNLPILNDDELRSSHQYVDRRQ